MLQNYDLDFVLELSKDREFKPKGEKEWVLVIFS